MKFPLYHIIREVLRSFFSRSSTIELHSEEGYEFFPQNYHGRLLVDAELCVGCGICERICPARALELERYINENEQRAYTLHYDFSQCAFCGLCVDNCPHSAITFKNAFVRAIASKEEAQIELTRGVYKPRKKD